MVLKLVLFEFVNTFLSLFYIAFYLQDIAMLKSQVFTMLIVIQIVNQDAVENVSMVENASNLLIIGRLRSIIRNVLTR